MNLDFNWKNLKNKVIFNKEMGSINNERQTPLNPLL